MLHLKRLGYGGEGRAAAFKDGRRVSFERVLRFVLLDGDWVLQDDIRGGGSGAHHRSFHLRAVVVHLGGTRLHPSFPVYFRCHFAQSKMLVCLTYFSPSSILHKLSSGHYVTYRRNPDESAGAWEWMLCDDSVVKVRAVFGFYGFEL